MYPLVNPYLSREQLDYLASGGKPTDEIYDLAERHAMDRLKQGKSPFAGVKEISPVPSDSQRQRHSDFGYGIIGVRG